MARTWQTTEVSYLNRYAKTKTLDELAKRFEVDHGEISSKLIELGLVTKDGKPEPEVATDPAIGIYEEAMDRLYASDWKKATALLEKAVETTDLPELAERARQLLVSAERRIDQAKNDKDVDPFLAAVLHHNLGDFKAAQALCEKGDRLKKDERFLYLAAAIQAAQGADDQAAELLGKAIDENPKNRVYAFHDSDFDALRTSGEHDQLFELG
ncbi:MAG: hypothetical protein AAF481_05780 [Acidobacteriota bacterium]